MQPAHHPTDRHSSRQRHLRVVAPDSSAAAPDQAQLPIGQWPSWSEVHEVASARLLDIEDLTAITPEQRSVLDLYRGALSESTHANYESRWQLWLGWCEAVEVPAVPARLADVTRFLETLVSHPVGLRLRAGSTVAGYASVINTAHRLLDLPAPGDDDAFRRFVKGVRKKLARPTRRVLAADAETVRRWLNIMGHYDELQRARDTALVALASTGRFSAETIARFDPDTMERHPRGWLVTTSGGPELITANGTASCPVAALDRLADVLPSGHALWSRLGTSQPTAALSGGGIRKIVARRVALAGFTPARGRVAPAEADRVIERILEPTSAELRDRGLLLVGWLHANRRANLSELLWEDLEWLTDRVAVTYRRFKTDPNGGTKYLHPLDEEGVCPVTALEAWRERVTRLIGTDPVTVSGLPLFLRVDRWGNLGQGPSGLSGQAIADLVKKWADADGLDASRYSGHSLRAGWITSAAESGADDDEIAGNSGHKDPRSIALYKRRVRRRNPAVLGGLVKP